MTFPLATDKAFDNLDTTTRTVDAINGRVVDNQDPDAQLVLMRTQQEMQMAMWEVGAAVDRRNSFTTKIVNEIR